MTKHVKNMPKPLIPLKTDNFIKIYEKVMLTIFELCKNDKIMPKSPIFHSKLTISSKYV